MGSFPFAGRPQAGPSTIASICRTEHERQLDQLIMIPSESICHPEAAAILTSELGNIYAEGLPQPLLCPNPRSSARDQARFQTWQTRLADRRFYKGTVGANRVELAAQDSIARVFARLQGSPAPDNIYVNVQPLSGAAANLAVYEALLKPGDRLMGLDLSHGGHLTHGSQFNFSGKTYEVHSYGVLNGQQRLDYDHIRRQAHEHLPRIIIGGASAYPWDFDWRTLRNIADEVGAYLLADVAHLAGLIAAGELMNPLPYAHAVTFTTHKTLCGPRGAVILTTLPDLAEKIDLAVFPGLQGGPHMNSIAAIGRLFELILEDYEGFQRFQRQILSNTAFFARCLTEQGFSLEYGGTNTHMLLVNLRQFSVRGKFPLDGETASRLLELAGIVCNKNVLPGDVDAAHSSGLRFGLPWLTQRGVAEEQLRVIAGVVKQVLGSVHTVSITSPSGEDKCRGRLPGGVLREAAQVTRAIAETLPYPPRTQRRETPPSPQPLSDRAVLLLRGDKVRLALSQLLTARLPLNASPVRTKMLRTDGSLIDDVVVMELEPQAGEERWLLLPHRDRAPQVRTWIEDLSDGYLLFDESDLQQKIDGPTVVEELDVSSLPAAKRSALERVAPEPSVDLTKPYFVGQRSLYAQAKLPGKPEYVAPMQELPLRKTVLNAAHRRLDAKMVPFAGWEMPVQYPSGIFAEHRVVRSAAGLFDVSHMSVLEVKGPHARAFLDQLLAGCVSKLAPDQAQYSYILRPDGTAIDDLFLYCLAPDRYIVVSNASNAEAVIDWINAVNGHRILVDRGMPAKVLDGPVDFRPLRDAGPESLVGLALQGPASRRTLEKLIRNGSDRLAITSLRPNAVAHVELAGIPSIVARTGYTGEKVGYEIMMHPNQIERFWETTLEAGKPLGVAPAGLGARDSTRVEAGLPLFGHELEGPLGISLTEAGYGFVPRFHVPFFIGREPYMERADRSRRHILRLQGQGRKSLRAGHTVVDDSGKAVGQVTSFAYVHEDMTFVVLACIEADFRPKVGQIVTGVRTPVENYGGRYQEQLAVPLTVLERFPTNEERESWPARYA